MNKSPWISTLKRIIKTEKLDSNMSTDICIIGGGISGVLSAYYILKNTNKSLIILDKGLFGHGASGHNAGMLIGDFEVKTSELLKNFSSELVINGHNDLRYAWDLFEELRKELPIMDDYFSYSLGFSGFTSLDLFRLELEDMLLRKNLGIIRDEKYYLEESFKNELEFDNEILENITFVPKSQVEELSDMPEGKCIGYSILKPVGVANSSQMVNDILIYLQMKYPERIKLFSNSNVFSVVEKDDLSEVVVNEFVVSCKEVVLATNGYRLPKLLKQIKVDGVVNYMVGVISDKQIDNKTYIYYIDQKGYEGVYDYVYGTRRKYGDGMLHTFGSTKDYIVGDIPYDFESEFPEEILKTVLSEANMNYKHLDIKHNDFQWHGLMGYTENYVRKIGRVDKDSKILFNIGCNGIGIIPAFYAGHKISKLINGENFPKSVWDIM